ncbi:hypothetical protein [Clostridium butyricum]|uniref:hypothetical protein n=1 Tax=Clostridium butyricum TaxID=1492 RepID=UPI00325A6137
MKLDRYDNLRNIISDLHNCVCDNDIMVCKLQAIKEFLDEEIEKNTKLKTKFNEYNIGLCDELNYITSKINKIMEEEE